MKVLITGSFDPITVGHLDIIKRAGALFDKVVVAVNNNTEKSYMFPAERRLMFINAAIKGLTNVSAIIYGGWAADPVAELGLDAIVKGLRDGSDFEYEAEIAAVNKTVNGVETVFLPCDPKYSRVTSTAVREMIKYGKDYRPYVPDGVVID